MVADRIAVDSEQAGLEPAGGEVPVVGEGRRARITWARWDDGHESSFMPEAGSARIIQSSRPRKRSFA
jgi:hypothetical protein